jgi:hypothetical protein
MKPPLRYMADENTEMARKGMEIACLVLSYPNLK